MVPLLDTQKRSLAGTRFWRHCLVCSSFILSTEQSFCCAFILHHSSFIIICRLHLTSRAPSRPAPPPALWWRWWTTHICITEQAIGAQWTQLPLFASHTMRPRHILRNSSMRGRRWSMLLLERTWSVSFPRTLGCPLRHSGWQRLESGHFPFMLPWGIRCSSPTNYPW